MKAEIGGADVVAIRGDEAPVIVELKTSFSLTLLQQGVARQSVTDWVYLAVPRKSGRVWYRNMLGHTKLCRRLGLGLLVVRLSDGHVEPRADPGPYRPRAYPPRRTRLLAEFARREGDPNQGGTAGKIVTAYRQDAVRCASCLAEMGPLQGAKVAAETGVARATQLMAANHYGWFERVSRGIYGLTDEGRQALSGAEADA